jgi:hypothetical protein
MYGMSFTNSRRVLKMCNLDEIETIAAIIRNNRHERRNIHDDRNTRIRSRIVQYLSCLASTGAPPKWQMN